MQAEDNLSVDPEDFNAMLDALFTRHYRYLLSFAQSRVCSHELAEDLVQETFAAVLEKPGKLLASNNPMAWLVGILQNLILYSLRSARYAEQLQTHLEQAYDGTYTEELNLDTLYGGCMSKEKLDLLIRFYVEDRTSKELASDSGISSDVCRKRIQRARNEFRRLLEDGDYSR